MRRCRHASKPSGDGTIHETVVFADFALYRLCVLQQRIDHCGLAVINVRHNCNIPNVVPDFNSGLGVERSG